MKPAAESAAGIEEVSDLGEAEGDRMVRPDGRAQDLPGIAVDAGGDVETEDRPAGGVDQVDHLPAEALDLPVEARPEKGVDDPVRVDEAPSGAPQDPRTCSTSIGSLPTIVPVGPGRPAEPFGIADEKHPGRASAGKDVACDDEAVAAVVSDPAEQEVPPPGDSPLPGEDLEGRPSCVFHEDLLGDPELFDGPSVHGPHLTDAADLHGSPRFFMKCRPSRGPGPERSDPIRDLPGPVFRDYMPKAKLCNPNGSPKVRRSAAGYEMKSSLVRLERTRRTLNVTRKALPD